MIRHVVIAGGGVGALEGLLALKALAPASLNISVLTASRHLTYRALATLEPFGGDPAPRLAWDAIAGEHGARWIPDVLTAVHPGVKQLETRDGPALGYDALLLALGARPEPALPGALTFSGSRDVLAVIEAIDALEAGHRHRIAFVAASGTAWTLPLYELALLAAERGQRKGLELAIELVTTESEPLGMFGPVASAAVARRLASAGIHVRTGTFAQDVEGGKLWLELEGPLAVDLVIALPRLHGPALPGLPHDERGFVPVDRYGRVRGTEHVWAVGDMTTRPLRQGGLATQQADVAAADIAAAAGAAVDVQPYRPVLQGVLLTGDDPELLRRAPHSSPASEVAREPLWSPPQKVAGRYLSPYLENLGVLTLHGGTGS